MLQVWRRSGVGFVPTSTSRFRSAQTPDRPAPKRHPARIWGSLDRGSTFLSYPGVFVPRRGVMFPEHEGRLSTGHAVDRHGDPDLMAEFSAAYLKQSWAIVPQGRLPRTISEMMPALHLLVDAAELALKADLIRSDKDSGGHSLNELYGVIARFVSRITLRIRLKSGTDGFGWF